MAKTPRPTMYRQGDVLLVAIGRLPSGLEPITREEGRIVLAHGEATGHAHAIDHEAAEFFTARESGRRFLRLPVEGIALLHEEHAPVPLPAGLYEVRRQREYTPERIRNVAD